LIHSIFFISQFTKKIKDIFFNFSEVTFKSPAGKQAYSFRYIRLLSDYSIGKLILVRGFVRDFTEVKSKMVVATYTCKFCGEDTYQSVDSLSFTSISDCPSNDCRVNETGCQFDLQEHKSKFIKFQELTIEEMDSLATIKIMCRGEVTGQVKFRDIVLITGILLQTEFKEKFIEAHV